MVDKVEHQGTVTKYTLTFPLEAEEWSKAMRFMHAPDEEGVQDQELPDVLVLQISNPETLGFSIKHSETGEPLPIAGITKFGFDIPTRFTLAPDGLHCKLAGKADDLIITPGGGELWEEWYTPEKTMADLAEDLEKDETEEDKPPTVNLPADLPQQTFQEMRILSYSLADTPTMRNWSLSDDQTGYLYKRPGERHEVKFDPAGVPDIWSGTRPDTPAAMGTFLRERGWKGLLALHMAANCALTVPDEPIPLDDFVRLLFDVRTAKDRNAKRVWVWETLCAIFNLKLYGVRAGRYKDPDGKVINLTFQGEPLIAPSPGTRTFEDGQQRIWPDDVPVTIGFTMGKWGKEARKNPKALQYFGNVRAIDPLIAS